MKIYDQLETRPIADLIPYARNSRTHSDAQVAQIAASITEFGFTNPVLIDGAGGIIAGHGRVLAARKLGMGFVPCLRLDGLSEAQKRAYVIADNKLALNAGWDMDILRGEMLDLRDVGEIDLSVLGFDPKELDGILTMDADLGTMPETGSQDEEGTNEHLMSCPKCGCQFKSAGMR